MDWATVLTDYAPELSGIDSAVGARCILRAQTYMDETTWGAFYQEGIALLSAHLAAQGAGGQTAGGPVSSQSAGGLSQSYAVPSSSIYSPLFLHGTRWGIQWYGIVLSFLNLRGIPF